MNPFDQDNEFFDEEWRSLHLDNARIVGKTFEGCLFSKCSFRECQFVSCKFTECNFTECDLSLSSVGGSSFREVKFDQSKVAGINWTVASWPRFMPEPPVSFEGCVISYSTFAGLSLPRLQIKGCVAHEVDFSEADLSRGHFSDTDLAGALFRHTNLTEAALESARNYTIDINQNTITKARFSLPEAVSLLRGLDIVLVDSP